MQTNKINGEEWKLYFENLYKENEGIEHLLTPRTRRDNKWNVKVRGREPTKRNINYLQKHHNR